MNGTGEELDFRDRVIDMALGYGLGRVVQPQTGRLCDPKSAKWDQSQTKVIHLKGSFGRIFFPQLDIP